MVVRKRLLAAITLLEVLTVVAIVAVVVALLLPAFAAGKRAALIAVSTSNLRQIYMATEIYRSENGERALFGDAWSMGLPPSPIYPGIPEFARLRPPLAPHESSPMVGRLYWHYFSDPPRDGLNPTWAQYTQSFGGGSVIYADPFFNPEATPLDRGDLFERFVIGITLDGSVTRKRAMGDWMNRTWWHR